MDFKDIFNSTLDVTEDKKHKKHSHKKGDMVKNAHTKSVGMVLAPFVRGYWPVAVLGGGHEHWRDDRCTPHTPSEHDAPAAANPIPAPPAPTGLGPANGDSGSTGNSASGADSGAAVSVSEDKKLTSDDAEEFGSLWSIVFTHCPNQADKKAISVRWLRAISSKQAIAMAKAKLPKEIQSCAKVASVKMMDKKSVKENADLQALGKTLKGTVGTKPTVADDEEIPTDVNTAPAEKDEADEAPASFKVGDKVKPIVGPHKDVVHSVIHVFPDGRINLKPDGLQPDQIKYRLGATTAKPEQVMMAEARITSGSMLEQFSMMEMKYEDPKNFGRKLFNKAMGIPSGPYKYKVGQTVSYEMYPDQAGGRGTGKIEKLLDGHHYLINGKPVNQNEIKKVSDDQVDEARSDGMMPLSYRPRKGHTIEAYGRKGMKNTMWRKYFKNGDEMEKWCEDHDATIEGQRDLDDNEKVK